MLEALENSISLYPALEGRFPQVSNIEFEFDPSKPPNSRIVYAKIGGAPIDLEKKYVLVTRGYMARGKDGFDSLLVKSEGGEAEEIVSEENGILISMMLRQYFMSLKIMGQWKMWGRSLDRHWNQVQKSMSIVEPQSPKDGTVVGTTFPLPQKKDTDSREVKEANAATHTEKSLDDSDDDTSADEAEEVRSSTAKAEREIELIRKVTRKWWRIAGLPGQPKCCDSMGDDEFKVDWTKVKLYILCDAMLSKHANIGT
jgi:5'-nucleotidase